MKQIIRRPNDEDIRYLIDNIRPIDREEIYALDGSTVEQTLHETPNLLENANVWEVNGKLVCLFGITPLPEDDKVGVAWLLATSEFDKHRIQFSRQCRSVFLKTIQGYEYLFNYIYEKNRISIKWLKSLGFTIQDKKPIGIEGANFHRFEMLLDV